MWNIIFRKYMWTIIFLEVHVKERYKCPIGAILLFADIFWRITQHLHWLFGVRGAFECLAVYGWYARQKDKFLWIIKVHTFIWNEPYTIGSWKIMKDNFDLKILLDHKSSDLDKTYLLLNCTTTRRKNWTHTDLEPPTHFQMELKSCH